MTYVKLTDHQSAQALAVMCRFLGLEGLQAVLGEALLKGASYCALDEQHMVFSQGQPGDYFYLILGGRVDTLRLSAEGEEHIIHHVVAGQLLAPHRDVHEGRPLPGQLPHGRTDPAVPHEPRQFAQDLLEPSATGHADAGTGRPRAQHPH